MLKEIRHDKGLSQRELANRAEMSFRTLQHYEQGTREIDAANLETILNLCLALNCRIEDILTNDELKTKLRTVMRDGA